MKRLIDKLVAYPNFAIFALGIIFAVALFFIAGDVVTKRLSDLLVNLSASMVTISLTVVLVDMFRQHNLVSRKSKTKEEAISRVISENTGLIMQLVLSSIRPIDDFRTRFISAGSNGGESRSIELETLWIDYTRRLGKLNSQELIKHQPEDKLYLIEKTVENLDDALSSILSLYGFALGIEARSLLVTVVSKAGSLKATFSVLELDDLREITDKGPRHFIAIAAAEYISAYIQLLNYIGR